MQTALSTHTEHLIGLTIHGENRLRDLRDWLCRHDVPDTAYIELHLDRHTTQANSTTLRIAFESYAAAIAWGWLHTKFERQSKYGWDNRNMLPPDSRHAGAFIDVPLPDFLVVLSFPAATHPDFQPQTQLA